jgi:hypothetical protein
LRFSRLRTPWRGGAIEPDDVAEIAADFLRIDVNAADHLEPRTRGDLPDDGSPNWSQTEMP